MAFGSAHFGAGTGPIYFDNTDCVGNESNLTDCSWSSYISCYYGHLEDAGVRCQGTGVISGINTSILTVTVSMVCTFALFCMFH